MGRHRWGRSGHRLKAELVAPSPAQGPSPGATQECDS